MNKELILNSLKISDNDLKDTGLTWAQVREIFDAYVHEYPDLIRAGEYIANDLMRVENVHSVRFRAKDPHHLVSKIIRKRIDNPARIINVNNYKTEITDLIGVRAIHLFKDQWIPVHQFILNKWNLKEQPIAYVRAGDSNSYIQLFEQNNFEIKTHPVGYRSLHYIATTKPAKETYFAEIQVRTIFEEGWSEIDHSVRYPNDTDNVLYSEFLLILNRLAGSADEMGSFVINLKNELLEQQTDFNQIIEEKDIRIKELENKISALNIKTQEKADIAKMINAIDTITTNSISEIASNTVNKTKSANGKLLLQAYNRYLAKEAIKKTS